VVGSFSLDRHGIIARVFNSIKDIPVRMISFGGSVHNISLLVVTEKKNATLNALNEGLFQLAEAH
jgi:aspartate kinase